MQLCQVPEQFGVNEQKQVVIPVDSWNIVAMPRSHDLAAAGKLCCSAQTCMRVNAEIYSCTVRCLFETQVCTWQVLN